MNTAAQELGSISSLRNLPTPGLAAAPWEVVDLVAGAPLWEEGQAADGIGVVVRGELSVESQSVLVGRVRPGEVVGEACLVLAEHARTATLRALVACRVLRLGSAALHELRASHADVYDALLSLAEHSLVRRIHEADLRVSQAARGSDPAPARVERSGLLRLWNALRPGLPSTPCPPLEPLLWVQPGLGSAPARTIAAIAATFTAEAVAAGTVLFLEGEPGTAAWLLAEGEVEVWRNVRGRQAERLATLGPGRMIGVNALIEGGARAASCVASTPCWLYRTDREVAPLKGAALRAWRESLLGSLTAQIRTADDVLGAALRNPTPGYPPFAEVLRAAGLLAPVTELSPTQIVPL